MATVGVPVGEGILQRLRSIRAASDRTDDSGHDPLLEMAQRYPVEAARFIKVAMWMGSASSVLVSVPCLAFLSLRWTACGLCNRPLRLWLLALCVLQLLHMPGRLFFLSLVCQAQHGEGAVAASVRRMTASLSWRASKVLSLATYAWFVLGVVWLLNSDFCKPCPGLYRLCLAVIVAAAVRLLLTLLLFRRLFPVALQDVWTETPRPKQLGASKEVISALPLVMCSEDVILGGPETSCAVCLTEFSQGDVLRRLPCCHKFHKGCIDIWLTRSRTCPLCLHDVEQQHPAKAKEKRA